MYEMIYQSFLFLFGIYIGQEYTNLPRVKDIGILLDRFNNKKQDDPRSNLGTRLKELFGVMFT